MTTDWLAGCVVIVGAGSRKPPPPPPPPPMIPPPPPPPPPLGGGGACGLIVTERVAVPVPPTLAAEIGIEDTPDCNGMPLMMPVVVSMERPDGSGVAEKLVGLFVATI